MVQIERESDSAELCFYPDLIPMVFLKAIEFGDLKIFNFSHDLFCLRQGGHHNLLPIVFASGNNKLVLKIVELNGVMDFNTGEILISPKTPDGVRQPSFQH